VHATFSVQKYNFFLNCANIMPKIRQKSVDFQQMAINYDSAVGGLGLLLRGSMSITRAFYAGWFRPLMRDSIPI
jgi:hypothetical protein